MMRPCSLVVWHVGLVSGACGLGSPLKALGYKLIACNYFSSCQGDGGSGPSGAEEVAALVSFIQVIKGSLKGLRAGSYCVLLSFY